MRHVASNFSDRVDARVHRVVAVDSIAAQWTPDLRLLAIVRTDHDKEVVTNLQSSGLRNVGWVEAASLVEGDIVIPQPAKAKSLVLHREADVHHSVLLTNRCNSHCLMCSQPPTEHDDSWLVSEAIDVVRHIGKSPTALGINGGEPLLAGTGLRKLIEETAALHPSTRIEILTNGRLFSDVAVVENVLKGVTANVSWLVPLYGHVDYLHDFVVQRRGAFEETVAGLLVLQEYRQPVQLRIVLIEPVLSILSELCGFIGRNLPFVREVALMACEPTGFALANREHCEVDLAHWSDEMQRSVTILQRYRVPFLVMNTPLCALPRHLWIHARKSISDWKNVYLDECKNCVVQDRCAGLFSLHERGWKPTTIRAIKKLQV